MLPLPVGSDDREAVRGGKREARDGEEEAEAQAGEAVDGEDNDEEEAGKATMGIEELDAIEEGIEAIDFAIARTCGFEIITTHKAGDPLTPSGFDALVIGMMRELVGVAAPTEKRAIKAFLRKVDVDFATMTEEQRVRVITEAGKKYLEIAVDVAPAVRTAIMRNGQVVVESVKGATAQRYGLNVDPSFNLIDRKGVEAAATRQAHYARDKFGQRSATLSAQARAIVSSGMERGLDRFAIAKEIEESIGDTGKTNSYWQVVASAFIGRSRSISMLSSFDEIGISKFQFEAVLDEVTSDVCRLMHGRTFSVTQAIQRFAEVDASEDPEAVKDLQPWAYTAKHPDGGEAIFYKSQGTRHMVARVDASAVGQRDQVGSFSSGLSDEAVERAGLSTPPLHGHCRSLIVPLESEVVANPAPRNPQVAPAVLPPGQRPPRQRRQPAARPATTPAIPATTLPDDALVTFPGVEGPAGEPIPPRTPGMRPLIDTAKAEEKLAKTEYKGSIDLTSIGRDPEHGLVNPVVFNAWGTDDLITANGGLDKVRAKVGAKIEAVDFEALRFQTARHPTEKVRDEIRTIGGDGPEVIRAYRLQGHVMLLDERSQIVATAARFRGVKQLQIEVVDLDAAGYALPLRPSWFLEWQHGELSTREQKQIAAFVDTAFKDKFDPYARDLPPRLAKKITAETKASGVEELQTDHSVWSAQTKVPIADIVVTKGAKKELAQYEIVQAYTEQVRRDTRSKEIGASYPPIRGYRLPDGKIHLVRKDDAAWLLSQAIEGKTEVEIDLLDARWFKHPGLTKDQMAKPFASQDEAREAFLAAFVGSTNNPVEHRIAARRVLATNGIQSYDELAKRGDRYKLTIDTLEGCAGWHQSATGEIALDKGLYGRAVTFVERWKEDPQRIRYDIQTGWQGGWALKTAIHEELHGASRMAVFGYTGPGVGMEEAGTELLATRYMRRLFGVDDDPKVANDPKNPWGRPARVDGKIVGACSYKHYIDAMGDHSLRALGLDESPENRIKALKRLEDAYEILRSAKGGADTMPNDPIEYARKIGGALGLRGDELEAWAKIVNADTRLVNEDELAKK